MGGCAFATEWQKSHRSGLNLARHKVYELLRGGETTRCKHTPLYQQHIEPTLLARQDRRQAILLGFSLTEDISLAVEVGG